MWGFVPAHHPFLVLFEHVLGLGFCTRPPGGLVVLFEHVTRPPSPLPAKPGLAALVPLVRNW